MGFCFCGLVIHAIPAAEAPDKKRIYLIHRLKRNYDNKKA
jgi:hypothetical protein